jgi:outer membrane immunogenic protein
LQIPLTGWGLIMHRVGALAAVAVFGFASVAFAADMPVKAPMAAPVAAYNWTGFYVGIAGGGGWGSTRQTNELNNATSGTDNNLNGGIFGGTYGFNWQWGSIVAGLEGDISWSGIKDSFKDSVGFCGPAACVTNLKWLGTDRARLGLAWDRYIAYATGGVAYGSVEATCCGGPTISDETKWRTGYAIGGGIEAMLMPNWSAKLEYLYVNLGETTNYHTTQPAGEKVLVKSNIVRLGINYHFAGWP